MEILNLGSKRFTEVIVLDGKGAGGANHEYEVRGTVKQRLPYNQEETFPVFAKVSFQNGPVKENPVNGVHQEDLLNIVIHRLQSFQSGDFRCRENALAITKIEEALMWLNKRTQTRQDKGIEGKSINHE